jgi:hypothetical protein
MRDGRTLVECKKGVAHKQATEVSELWGAGPWWQRLVPSPVVLPPHLAPDILGFSVGISDDATGTGSAIRAQQHDAQGGAPDEAAFGGGDGESDWEGAGSGRRAPRRRPLASSASAGGKRGLLVVVAWSRLPAVVLCLNASLVYAA